MPTMLLLKNCKPKLDEVMPENDITTCSIRRWVLEGKIKSVTAGRRRLINFGSLLEFLSSGDQQAEPVSGIRAVPQRLGR